MARTPTNQEENSMPQPNQAPQSPGERQIERAKMLERERVKVQKQISDNRDYLRLMERNGELSADEKKWVKAFYPQKERGERRSKDEITATRKAKEAARKQEKPAAAAA